jgi:hypothetical protein
MATVDVSLAEICSQRRKQMLFTVPPPRNTILDKSPYLQGYTSAQLNMRRKAEILKYSGNKQSTQTNSTTKKEFYKMSMGTIRSSRRVLDCSSTDIIYTRSGAAGVPGAPIDLFLDNSIPLYNYAKDSIVEGISEVEVVDKWRTINIDNNTFFNDDEMKEFLSLNITEIIDLPRYTFNVSIPIGFNITGSKINNTDNIYDYKNITISLNQAVPFDFVIKYNDNIVQVTNPIISYSYDVSNLSSFTFDISNNADSFDATLYAGVLNISNIDLYTEPGYVYDFYIKPQLSINIGDANITSTFFVEYDISYGILMNMTEDPSSNVSNSTLLTDPSTKTYDSFLFSNV